MASPKQPDWSAKQYLKFDNERTRPVYDMISQIVPHIKVPAPRIYDLGCGPGNSTKALLDAFPSAKITGMDSSPDMLKKAQSSVPNAQFVQGNLATFELGESPDLVFSNAVFHWLRQDERIPTLTRFFSGLKSGAVVAIQVPSNYNEPSHRLMRDTALVPSQAWSRYFSSPGTRIGDLSDKQRPDLDPIEPAAVFYNALIPHAESVNVWRTTYSHVLKDAGAIVGWVKSTGLQPFLHRMGEDEEAKAQFLEAYESKLKGVYPEMVDGKVLLEYPRLFVVAVKK